MGPLEQEEGASALIRGGIFSGAWRLGRIFYGPDRHNNMRFEYESGREFAFVKANCCVFGPTPQLVAEKLDNKAVVMLLQKPWIPVARALRIHEDEVLVEPRRNTEGVLPAGVVAARGDAKALRTLLNEGALTTADLAMPDGAGMTPLHWAASVGAAATLEAIVALGNFGEEQRLATDASGKNVAHHAVASGIEACLRSAAKACNLTPEHLSAGDHYHQTPAHLAAAHNSVVFLACLRDLKASLFETMGKDKLAVGTVVFVRQKQGTTNAGKRGSYVEMHPPSPIGIALAVSSAAKKFRSGRPDEIQAASPRRPSLKGPQSNRRGSVSRRGSLCEGPSWWATGRITDVSKDFQLTVLYESGTKEGYIDPSRAIFAPTPMALAEALGCGTAATFLSECSTDWHVMRR